MMNMYKCVNVLFMGVVLIFTNSCLDPKPDSRVLTIVNLTNDRIYYFDNINDSLCLPLDQYNPNTWDTTFYYVNSIAKYDSTTFSTIGSWEDYTTRCVGGKYRLFIIQKSLVDKYGWKVINERNLYTRKYLFDVDDMANMNWTLKYESRSATTPVRRRL